VSSAKFTRSGSITVSGGVSKDGLRIFLSVSDTGLGIPKDKFGQIFGAFEQVYMSKSRSYGGTCLGLHLVKQLVEAHNGEGATIPGQNARFDSDG
jgi:signal transduction histidine kinase